MRARPLFLKLQVQTVLWAELDGERNIDRFAMIIFSPLADIYRDSPWSVWSNALR
jgi:hypothetical protein